MVSNKVVERLSHYHFILTNLYQEGVKYIYSHDLAGHSYNTAAQVRRDIMILGYSGNPRLGYRVKILLNHIERFFQFSDGIKAVLIGAGNLGRAILTYFMPRKPKYNILAAFDNDEFKIDRRISGCQCRSTDELGGFVKKEKPVVALLTIPAVAAQELTDVLVTHGIKGIINFSGIKLNVPENIYVENIDLIMTLEKVAFFARQQNDNEIIVNN